MPTDLSRFHGLDPVLLPDVQIIIKRVLYLQMSNSWLHQETSSLHAAASRLLSSSAVTPSSPPDIPLPPRPGADVYRAVPASPRRGTDEVNFIRNSSDPPVII